MALAAATVVDAVAARLAPSVAAGRVYTDRAWPLPEASLPVWTVTAESESVEAADLDGDLNQHSLTIVCRGKVKAVSNVDDAMHALTAAGEALLFAPPVPYQLQLTGRERAVAGEGEAAIGEISVSVQATFFVRQSAPQTIVS